jgi:hypothetical protein
MALLLNVFWLWKLSALLKLSDFSHVPFTELEYEQNMTG